MPGSTLPAKIEHATDQFLGEILPRWLTTAPPAQIAALRRAFTAHMASQRKVKAVFERLVPLHTFVQDSLQAAITRDMGLTIDLARACWREERRTFTVKPGELPSGDSYFVTVPALQVLMQNFKDGESFYSETALIYPADEAAATPETVLSKDAAKVVSLCRKIDAGKQYQQHLARLFTDSLTAELGEDLRCNFVLMAELAATRGALPSLEVAVLRDLGQGRLPKHSQSPIVRYGELQILDSCLSGLMVIELSGDWKPGLAGAVKRNTVNGVLLCMADDPDQPVRHLSTWDALNTLLVQWLNDALKRERLVQRVALHDRAQFLETLSQRLLDDEPDLGVDLSEYVGPAGQWFASLAGARLQRIRDDARFVVVPTADVDARQSAERLALMKSVGMTILNLAGAFAPVVGGLLLADMVRQTLAQVCEGVVHWAQGHQHEALEHALGVAETVAVNAAVLTGAKVVASAFKRSAWLAELEPVVNDANQQRLWRNDLTAYQDANPPAMLLELDNGLLSDGVEQWWRHEGQHYRVRATALTGRWRLVDVQDPTAYGPALAFNGERGWRLQHERPLEWQGVEQLLGRLWPAAQALQAQRIAQVLNVADVDDVYLRGLLVENRPLPIALRDTLERFAVDARIDRFVAAIGIGEPDTELWQWCMDELDIQDLGLPAQRAAIGQQAPALRERMFEHFTAQTAADDPQLALVLRDFPGLPKPYAVHLLKGITLEQRVSLRSHGRIPLAVAQQARQLLQVAQLTRLREGLYLNCCQRGNQLELIFALLEQPGRWPLAPAVEVREGSATGARIASLRAPVPGGKATVLVRAEGGFRVHIGAGSATTEQSEPAMLADALLACLDAAERARLGWEGPQAAQKLRGDLQVWLPAQRSALLQLLGKPDAGVAPNPMRRLADGRIGYLLSGRLPGDHPPLNLLRARIRGLYPGFDQQEVQQYLDILLQRPGSAYRNLLLQEQEYRELKKALELWIERARGSEATALRRRAARRLRRNWQLIGERIVDQWDIPQGMSLSLADMPLRSLPHLPLATSFSHVAELTLTGLRLEQVPEGFLRSFTRLRWLNLGDNALTSVPPELGQLSELRNLRLAGNQITLSAASVSTLARLTRLQVLDLSFNPLGSISLNLRPLARLRELSLRSANLLNVPSDLHWCGQLEIADLRDNHLASVPQAVLDAPEQWRRALVLNGNPLPAALSRRFGIVPSLVEPVEDLHAAATAARNTWLQTASEQVRGERAALWDALYAESGSRPLFQLLTELVDTQDFHSVPADLRRRVWALLEDAGNDPELREELFTLASNPRTCVDSVASCFSTLEVRRYVANALRASDPAAATRARLRLARQLFRLDQVEMIAREDMNVRRAQNRAGDEIEISLAYRTGLAIELDLPGQPRTMHFQALAGVTREQLAAAAVAVRQAQASDALPRYISQREYWLESLRAQHGQAFSEVEAPFWVRLQTLESAQLDSVDYLRSSNELAIERQDAVELLALRLTREALASFVDD